MSHLALKLDEEGSCTQALIAKGAATGHVNFEELSRCLKSKGATDPESVGEIVAFIEKMGLEILY